MGVHSVYCDYKQACVHAHTHTRTHTHWKAGIYLLYYFGILVSVPLAKLNLWTSGDGCCQKFSKLSYRYTHPLVYQPALLDWLPARLHSHLNRQLSINSVALSPQANYIDWETATCWRNLVPTFVDREVSRGQHGGSPTAVNLSFLDRQLSINKVLNLLGVFPGLLQYICRTGYGEHQHSNWNRYWIRPDPIAGHRSSILLVQVHKWLHQMKPLCNCKEKKNSVCYWTFCDFIFLRTSI
jgi:hypothetical protein